MFERYTEKARRVIFFARYEASQYGSISIDTEHLLLGLLREDSALGARLFAQPGEAASIREEVDNRITRRERISTSLEIPLSMESKRALNFAAEEADRLGHRHVGTEHVVLGLLRVEQGVAASILGDHGVTLAGFRERLEGTQSRMPEAVRPVAAARERGATSPTRIIMEFLLRLGQGLTEAATQQFFAPNAQYIDAVGQRWTGETELSSHLAGLIQRFSAGSADLVMEETMQPRDGLCLLTLLWGASQDQTPKESCRMVVTLARGGSGDTGWLIYSIQVTPVTEK